MSSPTVETEKGATSTSPMNNLSPALPSTSAASKSSDDSRRPTRTPTPEQVKCAICLGDVVNKSYSNTCMHQFCFGCLLEWSKVKRECPLCKSQFRTIYHNIRTSSDYDEYVVPMPIPIPHVSIRGGVSSNAEPRISSSSISGSRGIAHTIMRDRLNDPRMIRVLQWAPFATLIESANLPNENPFHSVNYPEFVGAALEMETNAYTQTQTQFSGYQARRRRYDRGQWVAPFNSTLQPGTVFFPSIEYFRSHPSATRRIIPWLHRELTVLISLTHTKQQMAFIFDFIMSFLNRYDIRSPEFREPLRSYIGPRTRHFQHEFYYFVLSGLSMEEFDRVAQYTSSSSTSSSSTTTDARIPEQTPRPADSRPPVVTIDSDVDESRGRGYNGRSHGASAGARLNRDDEDIEITISDDEEPPYPRNPTRSTNRALDADIADNLMIDQFLSSQSQDYPFNENLLSGDLARRSQSNFAIDLSDSLANANAYDLDAAEVLANELIRFRGADGGVDPEMPILEPQVDLNNLSSSSAPRRSESRRGTYSSSTIDQTLSSAPTRVIDLITETIPDYLNPSTNNVSDSVRNLYGPYANRDPVDGRRSPLPFSEPPSRRSTEDLSFTSSATDLRTSRNKPDAFAENRTGPEDYRRRLGSSRNNRNNNNNSAVELNEPIPSSRSYILPPELWTRSNSPPYSPPTPTPSYITERSSCIHNNPSTNNPSSIEVRIFPTAMDLPLRDPIWNRGHSVIRPRPRTPGRPPTPPENLSNSNNNNNDEGECEFLGVHPIVKKAPLAVITLDSSDDEDVNQRFKNEHNDYHTIDPVERDAFMDGLLNDAAADRLNDNDFMGTDLSSLPHENLVERHLDAALASRFEYPMSAFPENDMNTTNHQYPSSSTVAGPPSASSFGSSRTQVPVSVASSTSRYQPTYEYFSSTFAQSEHTLSPFDSVTANDNDSSQNKRQHSSKSKKKRKKIDEKKDKEPKRNYHEQPPLIDFSMSLISGFKNKSKKAVRTRSRSSSVDTSEDSSSISTDFDETFGFDSLAQSNSVGSSRAKSSKRKVKSSKKKKSKKSRRSKSKSSKKEKVKEFPAKKSKSASKPAPATSTVTSETRTPSTSNFSGATTSSVKISSKVVKVDNSVKIKKAKRLTYSSESSDDQEYSNGTSPLGSSSFKTKDGRSKRLRSVVVPTTFSSQFNPSHVSKPYDDDDDFEQDEEEQAMDLSGSSSPFRSISPPIYRSCPKKLERHWETDGMSSSASSLMTIAPVEPVCPSISSSCSDSEDDYGDCKRKRLNNSDEY